MWIEINTGLLVVSVSGSLPARGVWIEIWVRAIVDHSDSGRSPQGECGLKYPTELGKWKIAARRSPQGECGLKCCGVRSPIDFVQSLPARGVWIEISWQAVLAARHGLLPARGVWIEIIMKPKNLTFDESLPARGVWIEIINIFSQKVSMKSLPARGVWIEIAWRSIVVEDGPSLPARGVWIEIQKVSMNDETFYKSLPARGVWIEIPIETD